MEVHDDPGKTYLVEKKPEYAVAAQELLDNIHSYLNIQSVTGARVLIVMTLKILQIKPMTAQKLLSFRSRR